MATKKENIASVLAFEKKLVPSDGFMYGTTWENRNDYDMIAALTLKEKSVRGTISNRLKAAIKNDPLKLNAEVEKPNLQRVDSCALTPDQDTLKLSFTLKVLSGVEQPSACNSEAFLKSYASAAKSYIETEGFRELARRYASNIANGRFLWRNRVGSEKLEVRVRALDSDDEAWVFDSTQFSTRNFDKTSPELEALATKIADALSGRTKFLLLEVNAFAQVGKAQDVYPSEELVLDKGNSKGGKSKVLYHVNDIAAMHSQKIGNALRTIDTWYPSFEDIGVGPIALEPYGAVTNLGKAYRNPKDKADFFTLFDKFAQGETLENKEDEHYVMGVVVRGGVFGESGKE
ncbi:MAG: type I-F CRISPR-associated protein Csy3 [Proteobacteria bacterium]|nr:MAG: type I-F CRISPR-associated protein Csy3 [Pseudomonadota bacterium]